MPSMNGTLYIVATPIGNFGDLSPRANMALQEADLIAAEDTRRSRLMLGHFGIKKKLLAYHDHNERRQTKVIIRHLQAGLSVALVSDAGTPMISDPGYHLLSSAHISGIKVVPIPGPSALITALSAAGFSADRFFFEGYLPARATARQRRLESLKSKTMTLVFYEAPHRICASLEALIICFGPARQATVAKEMSKLYETIRRDSLAGLLDWLRGDSSLQQGEFVIVVEGFQGDKRDDFDVHEAVRILRILLLDHPVKKAVGLTSKIMQGHRNRLYKLAMKLQRGDTEYL